jgi:aminoglycoside 3-N-acetyltransferase I
VTARRLGGGDAALVQGLVAGFHGSEVSADYARRILANSQNVLFAAEVEGELVGFVWAHWLDRLRKEQRQLFVYEIEVAGEHRRHGVGLELMKALLAEAEAAEADAFVLTNRSNTGALAFFEALGGLVESGDDVLLDWKRGG